MHHVIADHPLLYDTEWSFQQGKSTSTALIAVTHEWATLMDTKKDIACIFFDLKSIILLYSTGITNSSKLC